MRSFIFGLCTVLAGCHFGSFVLPLRSERGPSALVNGCNPLVVRGSQIARPYGSTSISTSLQFVPSAEGLTSPGVTVDSAIYSASNLSFATSEVSTEDGSIYVFSRINGIVSKSAAQSDPVTLRFFWTPEGSRSGCVASFLLRAK